MSLCGLKKKSYKTLRPSSAVSAVSAVKEGKQAQRQPSSISKFTEEFHSDYPCLSPSTAASHSYVSNHDFPQDGPERFIRRRRSTDLKWAREDQLSVILENLSETGSRRENELTTSTIATWDTEDLVEALDFNVRNTQYSGDRTHRNIRGFKRTRFVDQDIPEYEYCAPEDNMSDRSRTSPEIPKPIAPPPRDLESIARVDASLIFEHFTTNDAWELGSALRNRLMPIATPVVINISLANQNQTLFHTCTHSGVMPDNDRWVARKRKTVLRWGCSTWYMHCKFGGDEFAFRDKYGLGNEAGEYAIHGGGVPIRVTGVEGVVAVVVVSGLKQDEDHAVVVEVIRELYY